MSNFEFVFSLFGLLLGLSLAEVLAGFGKALKARHTVRVGWLTPMLGLLIMLDLTSFWTSAWALRDALPVKYFVLMLLLVFTSAYYLAATLVFPNEPHNQADYDEHYWRNKRLIVGAVFILNLLNYGVDWARGATYGDSAFGVVVTSTFLALLGALWLARKRVANVCLLGVGIALYPAIGLYGMLT
jgi:hypothetical protein